MSKIYVPKKVDKGVAEAGKWVDSEDDAGIFYGSYKVRFMDPHSQKDELQKKQLWSKHGCNNSKDKDFYKRMAVSLAYMAVLDWKLPSDPDDKAYTPPKFDQKTALEFFDDEDNRHILIDVARKASDNANFQSDDIVSDTTKN